MLNIVNHKLNKDIKKIQCKVESNSITNNIDILEREIEHHIYKSIIDGLSDNSNNNYYVKSSDNKKITDFINLSDKEYLVCNVSTLRHISENFIYEKNIKNSAWFIHSGYIFGKKVFTNPWIIDGEFYLSNGVDLYKGEPKYSTTQFSNTQFDIINCSYNFQIYGEVEKIIVVGGENDPNYNGYLLSKRKNTIDKILNK